MLRRPLVFPVLALSLLLAVSNPILAAGQPRFSDREVDGVSHGEEARVALTWVGGLPEGPDVGVIVEFNASPIVERTMRSEQAASAQIEDLARTLRSDLSRILGRGSKEIQTEAESESIRFVYKQVIAGASVRVPRSAVEALRHLPYVRAVHLDRHMEALLANSVPAIGAPLVWSDLGLKGKGVVVAVIDTGIDYRHPALSDGFGPGHRVRGGYDFFNEDADPNDDNGHGTHVAGIVGGNQAPVVGVAPEVTFLAYKVLDHDGGGETSTIIAGIDRAVDPNADGDFSDHADVINLSLGGPREFDDPLVLAVERATAAGVVVVVAAGNNGENGGILSPAVAPSVITVGATERDDTRAWFSSRGPVGGPWLTKPEVVAPGVAIVSARPGGRSVPMSGTSMAAPHIAGVAALLRQRHPDWTPAEIKTAIVTSAKPAYVTTDSAGVVTHEETVLGGGGGRVDARAAMDVEVLPFPSAISFGVVAQNETEFQGKRTLRLVNRGTTDKTIEIRPGALPKGVVLDVLSPVTIAAGATADVPLVIHVPPAVQANEDSLAVAGWLQLTVGASHQRVPWMVVKGGVLRVVLAGDRPAAMAITRAVVWPEGPRAIGAIPRGAWDVIGYFPSEGDGLERLVVREAPSDTTFEEITLSPQDAKFRVEFRAADENGVPFDTLVATGQAKSYRRRDIILNSMDLLDLPVLPESTSSPALLVSPLKTTWVRTVEVLSKGTSFYATMYRVLEGVDHDELVEVRAGDWASQAIEHTCRTPGCQPRLWSGAGSLPFFDVFDLPKGAYRWKLFLTQRVHSFYDFRSYVSIKEEGTGELWDYLTPALRNVDGRTTVAPMGRGYSSIDFVSSHPEAMLPFGKRPPILHVGLGPRRLQIDVTGAMGETLALRDCSAEVKGTDPSGADIPMTSIAPLVLLRPKLTSGVSHFEIAKDYTVEGILGRVVQTTDFDASEVKGGAPALSSFRLETAGELRMNVVPERSESRLIFGARDITWMEDNYSGVRLLVGDATRVWWRRSGTTEWQPLAVVSMGAEKLYSGDLPGPPGNVYSADLRPLLDRQGPIDLKFFLLGPKNSKSEIVYQPAFLVGPPEVKRRAVR